LQFSVDFLFVKKTRQKQGNSEFRLESRGLGLAGARIPGLPCPFAGQRITGKAICYNREMHRQNHAHRPARWKAGARCARELHRKHSRKPPRRVLSGALGIWERHHDIGVFTKFNPAAFEQSKRDLNATRGKEARYGKMLKRASRAPLADLRGKAVEDAIAKRQRGRFSVTKNDAEDLCPVANAILKQQASSMAIELEDNDLLTPNQTLKWLSRIKGKKKSGL
jgi:hypothetical protein